MKYFVTGATGFIGGQLVSKLTAQADYTFYATAEKARRELGWQPRPLEQTFKEVLDGKLAQRKK